MSTIVTTLVAVDPIPPNAFEQIFDAIKVSVSANAALAPAVRLALIGSLRAMLDLQGRVPLPLNDPNLASVVAQFISAGYTQAQVTAALSLQTIGGHS